MPKIKFWKILFVISFILNSILTFLWFSKPQEVIQYKNPGEVVVIDPINTLSRGEFKNGNTKSHWADWRNHCTPVCTFIEVLVKPGYYCSDTKKNLTLSVVHIFEPFLNEELGRNIRQAHRQNYRLLAIQVIKLFHHFFRISCFAFNLDG